MKHGDHFDGNLYPDILVLVTRDIDSIYNLVRECLTEG